MKSLTILIKLHKKNLDAMLVQKNLFEDHKDKLEEKKRILIATAQKEIKQYYTSDYAYMLDQYLAKSRKDQEQIQIEVDKLNDEIKLLQDKITKEFSEVKKFEIAKENKIKAEKDKEKKLETIILNEYATDKFIRKTD